MSERPNVTVVYQDGQAQTANMGCLELAISAIVIAILFIAFGVGALIL